MLNINLSLALITVTFFSCLLILIKAQAEDLFGSAWVYAEVKEVHRLHQK